MAHDRPRGRAPAALRHAWPWALFALVLAAAPLLMSSGFALTLLSQIGIAVIACLAYNILLGQGGMLSFGHAVYTGLGAFLAIHTLNLVGVGRLMLPVSLVPLAGAAGGLFFAAVLGYLTTRKAGTTFAMITLGIGELVWSMSLMLPGFFGGEGGVRSNRVVGAPVWGVSFGPQVEVYCLIAVYCFICTALMYAFTRTPLGRLLNAVRDNPERVEFIGYSTQRVRYLAFMASGLFSGVAGGLAALHFELVTAEVVGAGRSAAYLLFVFLGGAGHFFGPILGAVLMVVSLVWLSALTQAWLLYLGLAFMGMVMFAPGGLSSLVMAQRRVAAFGLLRPLLACYLALVATAGTGLVGAGAMIEMAYHLQLNAALGPELTFLGVRLNAQALDSWFGAAGLLLVGGGLFELVRRPFVVQWRATQAEIEREIEHDISRREPAP